MAEASAVIGILSFGIQVCHGITKYYGAWRDCPEEVSATSNTIDSLRTIFVQFKDILADKQLEKDTRTLVEERVSACLAGLRKLEAENKQFGSDKPSKFQMAVHRLAYPFKQDTLDRLTKVVGGLLGQLIIALQVLDIRAGNRHHDESSAAIADTQRAIEKVCTEVNVVRDLVDSVRAQHQFVLGHANANHADTITHLERLRLDGQQMSKGVRHLLSEAEAAKLERILTWLRAPDVMSDHNAACLRRHAGTGQWFLNSAEYLSWKYGGTVRLWVHGKIGCCKTILASTVIEDMRSHCRTHAECCLAYFYFTFSDDKKQSWEALLRTLVMQLSQGRPAVHLLTDAYKQEYGRGLTVRDLEAVLVEILMIMRSESKNVYIVVDGLDESPDTLDHRVAVFEGLSRIRESCSDLRLIITSRRYADIERFMVSWESASIELTAALVNEDIKAFVRHQLVSSVAFRHLEDASKTLIISKLGESPDGMFRWAALHLETLRKLPSKTHFRIEKALSTLPPTLSASYEQMLSDIPDDCATQIARCLLWLALSPRPLALYELVEASRGDHKESNVTLLDLDVLDPGDIVEVMSGMVIVHNEYRVCRRCRSVISGNYFICHVCSIGYYHLCEPCRSGGERCRHASHALVSHDTLRVQLAHASVKEFLLGCGAKAERARRFLIDKVESTSILSRVINRPDVHGFTALHLAIIHERIDEVRLLLTQGANANVAAFGSGSTPLHLAAGLGDARYMTALLANGANVNALNARGYTALTMAMILGCIDTHELESEDLNPIAISQFYRNGRAVDYGEGARLLLQHGADPNLGLDIVCAAEHGFASIVRLQLDGGADANSKDSNGTTALRAAVTRGYDEIATMLLMHGAGEGALMSDACPALWDASAFGHHLVVQTTLAHSVNTAHTDSNGWTALHYLAWNCDGDLARECEEDYGLSNSARQLPLQERYGLILDMLLAQDGAKINQPDYKSRTPLMLACKYGQLCFIERLLDHGPDLEARDNKGWTALFHAVYKDRVSVADLLIKRGACVNTLAWLHEGETGWMQRSLLGAASHWHMYRIYDLLKANGAKLKKEMDAEQKRCGMFWPPSRSPKCRRSWPRFRCLGPLKTRPSISAAPHQPFGIDEEIRWDTDEIPSNLNSVWWDGERSYTLRRSLSLV
ncbi:hypothetical protein LTR56_010063 [Elasticomyces elasticus]|nr:hypothetical protein LTR56_010063 [Elasticomyces elasticus]KAK3664994.1 hypothetical protein LTR22_004046 [Elasticomyces elasticus]KAK4931630.1 hypothetical protein LTR49_002022 [Elasticomyces elasticus]KAK5766789.1 hypothetical protein LTS12_003142 [Elasticomyces elasticus]